MTSALAESSGPGGWLLSHPQLVVVLFVGATWLVKMINRARSAAQGPVPGPQGTDGPESGGKSEAAGRDLEDEERARRVREEILRKIAERRAGAGAAQPARARTERQAQGPPAIPKAAPASSRVSTVGTAAAVAPAAPQAAQTPMAPRSASAVSSAGVMAGPTPGSLWLDELRSRDSARRAILVREILGPPVALR
jgi:hypothetical protein